MKKVFNVFFLVIIIQNLSLSQIDFEERLVQIVSKGKSISEIKGKIDPFITSLPVTNISREIILGHVQLAQDFFISRDDGYLNEYRIICQEKDEVYFKRITKWTLEGDYKEELLFNYIDSIKHKGYFGDFKRFHKMTNKPVEDLESLCYGEYTQMKKVYPKVVGKLLRLINKKKVQTLKSWLYSTNPETQLCGAIGLKVLNKFKGKKLHNEELQIIGKLEERSTPINMCEGCSVLWYKPMMNLLSDAYIDRFYKEIVKIQ